MHNITVYLKLWLLRSGHTMKQKNRIIIILLLLIGIVTITLYINKSNYEIEKHLGIYERPFKDYVVFYPQHQDDEVLWGGSAIRKAINECGSDHVFVVLVSDGSGVNFFNNRIYKNLTRKQKEELRNKEFRASLKDLGIKPENIIILADIDHKVGNHFDLMQNVALGFEHKYKSVTHVAQSYKYDDHPMHRKNGKVIYDLYKTRQIKDAIFFLKPKYVSKVSVENRIIYNAINYKDKYAIRRACMEYKVVDPTRDRKGIGYISAHSYFDHLLKDEELTSILHLPK